MAAEQWPTEEAATVAVDAAARHSYEAGRAKALESLERAAQTGASIPEWDALHPVAKQAVKNEVLPVVWAALQALPDPRYAVYEEGYADGYGVHPGDQSHPNGNPYPSGL